MFSSPPKIPSLILPKHLVFNTQRQKAFEFVQDSTKQVITLSTGILTLTVTFVDKLEREGAIWNKVLGGAWALYVVAIICGLWVLYALAGTLEQKGTNLPISVWGENISRPSRYQLATFLLATILIVIFAIFSPPKIKNQSERDKLVAEFRNQTTQLLDISQNIKMSRQSIEV